MFGLEGQALSESVLDCCAGTSSFVAELGARGGHGTAVDPVYALSRAELESAALRGLGDGDRIIASHDDRFTWDWYGSPARRADLRRMAAARFLADIADRPANYIAAALPDLPFTDGSYDLVVCSHLLFTWSNAFDADWHLAAITELARIARRDVRVYPLVAQGTGDRVPFLDTLIAQLHRAGHDVETCRVPYVFQRGAESMLTIRPAAR